MSESPNLLRYKMMENKKEVHTAALVGRVIESAVVGDSVV